MNGKRELLSNLLWRLRLVRVWPRSRPNGLTILAYHRVLDMGDEDAFPGDPELVSASVACFHRQMVALKRFWSPIPLADAVSAVERGQALPPRSVVVTFDDGHGDNYSHAYPILKELGIPATIFLSTGYIGTDNVFWFDRVCTLFYLAPAGNHKVTPLADPVTLGNVRSRRDAAQAMLAALKQLPDAQMRSAVAELESRFGDYAPAQKTRAENLTWEQVCEMSRNGIDFGSHTVSHPILTRTGAEQLRHELAASREAIEQNTGRTCDILAYPVGKPYAYNQKVIETARSCGYRAALSYVDGVDDVRTADLFALKRVSVERYYSHPLFLWRMLLPRWFV